MSDLKNDPIFGQNPSHDAIGRPTTLTSKITAACALTPGVPYPGHDEMNHREGEKFENARLTPIILALAAQLENVVGASWGVLIDIEKHMPDWREEVDAPDELFKLERALAKLEQILNDARER
mgnify:FL=1